MLRKIFGLVNIDNIWRIRNNMEIDELIEGADIVRFIRAQRIKWPGNIQRMDQTRLTRKLSVWKPMYENQTSRKTKTKMTRKCHGRSKKAKSQKLEGGS
jgi:hypothetical protein